MPQIQVIKHNLFLFCFLKLFCGKILQQSDDYGKSWSKQIEFVDASNNEYAISVYPTSAKYANGYFHIT